MWRTPETRFDCACAISQGTRDTQEDAVVTDFPLGSDSGFAILADGMGGHNSGDMASRHVITQLYAALKFNAEEYSGYAPALPDIMTHGLEAANDAIRDHVRQHPRQHGMGSTLVCLGIVEGHAQWISVGDSPLYLMRAGELQQLNQNHSLAHELDLMVQSGAMDAEEAKCHPDRSALTSAIIGGQIAHVDCPNELFELQAGDTLLLTSDGLQYLGEAEIARLLNKHRRRSASEIARYLLTAVERMADPDQDNVSLAVIKVNHVRPAIAGAQIAAPTFRSRRPDPMDQAAHQITANQSLPL